MERQGRMDLTATRSRVRGHGRPTFFWYVHPDISHETNEWLAQRLPDQHQRGAPPTFLGALSQLHSLFRRRFTRGPSKL